MGPDLTKVGTTPRRDALATLVSVLTGAALLPASASAATAGRSGRDPDAERELRSIEQRRAEAFASGDLAYIDRTTAEECTFVHAIGDIQTKAHEMAHLKGGVLKFEVNRLDDLIVRVYGDTAILNGLSTQRGTSDTGEFGGRYRFTRVYVRRDARWQLVATQSASVSPEAVRGHYEEQYDLADRLFGEGAMPGAWEAIQTAQKLDPLRYEACALAALILSALNRASEASAALVDARQAAGPFLQGRLGVIEAIATLRGNAAVASSPAAQQATQVSAMELAASALTAIDQARVSAARAAGRALLRVPPSEADDRDIEALLARRSLAARGTGALASPWTNSLGMRFVTAGRSDLLFCVWETRVQDFATFVADAKYDADVGMYSYDEPAGKLRQKGDTWRSPGFKQAPDHPVCGVSWYDAKAFCRWLTLRERASGQLPPGLIYRLPTDADWSALVGNDPYPWGRNWPPLPRTANLAGDGDALPFTISDGYVDGMPRTAPVGTYRPNAQGLYDLSGNVWEWCEDWYPSRLSSPELREHLAFMDRDLGGSATGVLRGGSWGSAGSSHLASAYRNCAAPGTRRDNFGFRLVVARDV